MAKRILITSDTLGKADAELGAILMRSFLVSLAHEENVPAAVMLSNDGVKLACEGSAAIAELSLLAEAGVTVTACGTCLKHFGLQDKLAVGVEGNMSGLVSAVCGPDDIVTIG
ncbi:MAG TPA: sulfurtransferase-like selenium metabolism protein YedF [Coriobacteriia bacterium]|nr:sulfurtransferase-like selenium metabolism protein YedF [Coriobacteriia bacterium]